MKPPVAIEPAGWRDLWGVWALERACFGPDAWGVLELCLALLGPGVRLKAVVPADPAALVGFTMAEPRPREGLAWIATIGVLPEYRRQGIGARLLAAVEAQLEMPLIKLTVRRSNQAAIALYEKFGYARVAVWERYYSGGEAGIVMEKRRAAVPSALK